MNAVIKPKREYLKKVPGTSGIYKSNVKPICMKCGREVEWVTEFEFNKKNRFCLKCFSMLSVRKKILNIPRKHNAFYRVRWIDTDPIELHEAVEGEETFGDVLDEIFKRGKR